jgi:Uma2 family endonuclease
MTALLKDNTISVEEYLQGELIAEIKHEYLDGYVYAMAGASMNHVRITSNLVSELGQHLKNMPCDVLSSDFKVNVNNRKFFYPDVVVICDKNDQSDKNNESLHGNDFFTQNPLLIVEVLSSSTQRTDRTRKRLAYQSLPSLQEYILIEQDFVDVEISRRSVNWDSHHYFLGDAVRFESLDFILPVTEIYCRVDNEELREFWQDNLLD